MNPRKKNAANPSPRLCDIGERAFLRKVRQWFTRDGEAFDLAIGDDCAALDLSPQDGPTLVSTDALIEGVHFRFDWISPSDLGARSLAVNLSDLAAMGARPAAAFLALGVPPETPEAYLKAFFLGLRAEGRRHGCPLVGGDLTRAPFWSINITVMGQPAVRSRIIRRSDAQPGQLLYVTGWPGESGAGRDALAQGIDRGRLVQRHRRPTPRLAEADILSHLCPDLAMLDVSDGVWNDADQLAEASGVAVKIQTESLHASPAMRTMGRRLGVDPRDWFLFGGEDYELLFATRADLDRIQGAFARAGLETAVHCIGQVTRGRGVSLLDADGREINLTNRTFRHF